MWGEVSAAPSTRELSGRYRGEIGTFRFQTDPGGAVKGFYESGGACTFKPQQAVFDGSIQGNVFIGRVSVCQTGTGCQPTDFYPVLAFLTLSDGALVAQVKLSPGCSSPALEGGRLTLQSVLDDGDRRPTSAVELAAGNKPTSRENAKVAKETYVKAARALAAYDYNRARSMAQLAISLNPNHADSHMVLGVAEVRMNRADAALLAFENARRLSPRDIAVHYNLACAFAKLGKKDEALESLNQAVSLGFADAQTLATDRDFSTLSADPEFKLLIEKLKVKRNGSR